MLGTSSGIMGGGIGGGGLGGGLGMSNQVSES